MHEVSVDPLEHEVSVGPLVHEISVDPKKKPRRRAGASTAMLPVKERYAVGTARKR